MSAVSTPLPLGEGGRGGGVQERRETIQTIIHVDVPFT